MRALIAAAGTGGHVFPGLSVAEALVDDGVPQEDIHFVGGSRLEAVVYPEAGFPLHQVELAGLQRSFTLKNLAIPRVVLRARDFIKGVITQNGITSVLGMGGYVTIPTGMAARALAVPFFNAEQNAEAGLANRVAARWARTTYGAFPVTSGLPTARWVGNPVRRSFWEFDRGDRRVEALQSYGFDESRPVLGVFGGSLGAGVLNDAAEALANSPGDGIQIVHLVGERNVDEFSGKSCNENVAWVRLGFEEDMSRFYAASDLVLARAGGAVAELTATSTPAVLVPGSFGSGGHQEGNARFLEDSGAAVVVEEEALVGSLQMITDLLFDRAQLDQMAMAARSIARPDAARAIAKDLVEAAS